MLEIKTPSSFGLQVSYLSGITLDVSASDRGRFGLTECPWVERAS